MENQNFGLIEPRFSKVLNFYFHNFSGEYGEVKRQVYFIHGSEATLNNSTTWCAPKQCALQVVQTHMCSIMTKANFAGCWQTVGRWKSLENQQATISNGLSKELKSHHWRAFWRPVKGKVKTQDSHTKKPIAFKSISLKGKGCVTSPQLHVRNIYRSCLV